MNFDKVEGITSWEITLQIYPLSGLGLPAQDRGWQIATTWKATPPREGVLFTLPNSIPACNRALHLQQSHVPTGILEFVNILVCGRIMDQWYTDPTSTMLNLRIRKGHCRSLPKLGLRTKILISEHRFSSACSVSCWNSWNATNMSSDSGRAC